MALVIMIGILILLTLHLVVLVLIKLTGMCRWKEPGDRITLVCLFLVPFLYDAVSIFAYYQLRSPV